MQSEKSRARKLISKCCAASLIYQNSKIDALFLACSAQVLIDFRETLIYHESKQEEGCKDAYVRLPFN